MEEEEDVNTPMVRDCFSLIFLFLLSTVRFRDHQRPVPGEVRRVSERGPEGRVWRRL